MVIEENVDKKVKTFKENNDFLEQIIMEVISINERLIPLNNIVPNSTKDESKEFVCIVEQIDDRLRILNDVTCALKNYSFNIFNKLYADTIKEYVYEITSFYENDIDFTSACCISINSNNLNLILSKIYNIEKLYNILSKCFYSQNYAAKLDKNVLKDELDLPRVDCCEEISDPTITEDFFNKLYKIQQSINSIKSSVIEIEKLFK